MATKTQYIRTADGHLMPAVLDQAAIDRLNRDAEALAAGGYGTHDALDMAAGRGGLEEVRERRDPCNDDARTMVLYRDGAGRLVNCWYEGVEAEGIGDGGCGFDDNLDVWDSTD
jgi:hypothetical protein